jgi:hypothetical protein
MGGYIALDVVAHNYCVVCPINSRGLRHLEMKSGRPIKEQVVVGVPSIQREWTSVRSGASGSQAKNGQDLLAKRARVVRILLLLTTIDGMR